MKKCENCLKLKEKLKQEIMKPLFINKEEYEFLKSFEREAENNQKLIRKLKTQLYKTECKICVTKQKAEEPLKKIISTLSKEYIKVFREWIKLKKNKNKGLGR